MNKVASLILVILLVPAAYAAEQLLPAVIADAVAPLPEALRGDATVVMYDKDGERKVLRQGTNDMICEPDVPGDQLYEVTCYPRSHDLFRQRRARLMAEGKDGEWRAIISKEIEAGTLKWPAVATHYQLTGPGIDNAMPLTTVYLPFATNQSTGLSEKRDHHRPWLMRAGTPFAHIMIPGK